jgi:hypothetical protein
MPQPGYGLRFVQGLPNYPIGLQVRTMIGNVKRSAVTYRRVRGLVTCLAVSTVLSCGDGGSSPITPGGGAAVVANVAGIWSGTATDALGQFRMTLNLTQTGAQVAGTMIGTTTVGAPLYNNGSVIGRTTVTAFNFSIAVPRGGIPDDPTCTASFTAVTNDLLATSMAGTYTGEDTCRGPFAGGRFQLLKQ